MGRNRLFVFCVFLGCGLVRLSAAAQEGVSEPEAHAEQNPTAGRNHQWGLDLGSGLDTDPDILEPFLPKGFARYFEWDYRFLVRDDAIGVNAHYRPSSVFGKLTMSYRRRMDIPARLGARDSRDEAFEAVGQDPPVPSRVSF